MMPYVITLTGASGCGKSKVIQLLHQLSHEGKYPDFKPVTFQKYTTRDFRDDEITAIKAGQGDSLDQRPVIGDYNNDDTKDADSLKKARLKAFQSQGCDLAYEQYGNRYGLRLSDLYEELKVGRTPIVILNDVRTVEDIKTKLGGQCFSIFIFREVPNQEHFVAEGVRRNEDPEETLVRFKKANAIYRIYIENIHIFDKLILNVGDGTESLNRILVQLLQYLCKPMAEFK